MGLNHEREGKRRVERKLGLLDVLEGAELGGKTLRENNSFPGEYFIHLHIETARHRRESNEEET